MQAHPHLEFYNGLTTFIMPRPQSKLKIPEFLARSIVSLYKDVQEEDILFFYFNVKTTNKKRTKQQTGKLWLGFNVRFTDIYSFRYLT